MPGTEDEMAGKGYSREGLFGEIYHYDEKGHMIGESRRGFLGGYTNYDEKAERSAAAKMTSSAAASRITTKGAV